MKEKQVKELAEKIKNSTANKDEILKLVEFIESQVEEMDILLNEVEKTN